MVGAGMDFPRSCRKGIHLIRPNSSLSDHLWPGSLVFFVQELVVDGMGLVQTARSTLAPTMVVTERKK